MGYVFVNVSETPDAAGVVECTWATGVNLARAAKAGAPDMPPATAAEREALRVAGGGSDTAGAPYSKLAKGLKARYGLVVTPSLFLPTAEPAEGTFLGVQGLYSHLPYRLQWPDRAFAAKGSLSSHSATVFKLNGKLLWGDPMVPWGGAAQSITWAEVVAYKTALSGGMVITVHLPTDTAGGNVGVDMAVHVDDPTPMTGDLAVGAQLYELDCVTAKVAVSVAQSVYSPFGITLNASAHFRAIAITTGGDKILLAVHNPDIANLRSACPPPPVGLTQADIDAAVAAQKAADAAALAAAKSATAKAVTDAITADRAKARVGIIYS